MQIIPAIDLLDGKVVRLTQGDYGKVKVYSENPVDIAKQWKDKGALCLHVVDLNGAKTGKPSNLKAVKDIINSIDVEVELGGGIRDTQTIEEVIKTGVDRVVLGTAVFKNKDFAKGCVSTFGEKVIFSIDVRKDAVAVDGWTKITDNSVCDCVKSFESLGLKRIIYTDILRDGMMEGPNIDGLENILKATSMEVVVSGGISTINDIKQLAKFIPEGLTGAIIGKALYEGKIDLAEAINVS